MPAGYTQKESAFSVHSGRLQHGLRDRKTFTIHVFALFICFDICAFLSKSKQDPSCVTKQCTCFKCYFFNKISWKIPLKTQNILSIPFDDTKKKVCIVLGPAPGRKLTVCTALPSSQAEYPALLTQCSSANELISKLCLKPQPGLRVSESGKLVSLSTSFHTTEDKAWTAGPARWKPEVWKSVFLTLMGEKAWLRAD